MKWIDRKTIHLYVFLWAFNTLLPDITLECIVYESFSFSLTSPVLVMLIFHIILLTRTHWREQKLVYFQMIHSFILLTYYEHPSITVGYKMLHCVTVSWFI